MCSNYTPVTAADRMLQFFDVQRPVGELPPEMWPGYLAPFIVRDQDRVEIARQIELGLFGMVPHWAKDLAYGRRTYNARSETADTLPTYAESWRRGRRCIVPAESIYEPCYETGKAVRWRIARADGRPMGIAGLWTTRRGPDGGRILSFTMLTVNADGHPVMQRMHKPGEEKRMVAILDEALYDAWLECPPERMRDFLTRYPAELLVAEPWPLPPR